MKRLLARRYGSEAGIALPMTLILMCLITSLTIAFLAFTSAEPVIAANHMANAQARAIAESGLERALWALTKGKSNPGFGGALDTPLPNPVPAPYDGSQFVNLGVGQFKFTVVNGPGANERTIEALGFVPTAANPIAIKKIRTVVTEIPVLSPPCAVCAGAEAPIGAITNIRIGGSASITASTTEGAVHCTGTNPFTPSAAAFSRGTVTTNGTPDVTGPSGGSAIMTNQPQSGFNGSVLDNDMMTLLKSLAKANGTYYQGNQTWTSPPPNGIIFVDTPSGNPLSVTSPSSDLITVDIHGNWGQTWSGWLVVAGSIELSGNIQLNGLIYAQNDVSMHGSGGGNIRGAVISTNRIDTQSTNVDTEDVGNTPISYDCESVRDGGNTIPQGWFVKPGTFREVSGTS
jgi:hypothetical protein